MNLNLRQLETFLWVAALRSFRKASERLNATQPAISSRIANLEESLGAKLFERDTGGIRLTSKGQELLPYAEKVLRVAQSFRERAGDTSSSTGVLRLGVSETIVHTLLPKFLSKLHESYPNVDVELTVDTTVNLRNLLVSRSMDIAFLMGPVSEYTIGNRPLADFPVVWAASPKLDIVESRKITIEEMTAFPLITYARDTRPYSELQAFLRENSVTPGRIFPSSSLAACLRMTIDGIGLGTLPKQMIQNELENGELVEIKCPWHPSDLHFTISYSAEPFDSLTTEAVALAESLKPA